MKYKPSRHGLMTRLADTRFRKDASVKLFPTGGKGWLIVAASTQAGKNIKRKILLSTPAMCAVLNMFCKLTIKLGEVK
jgi:hypothetical protein